MDEAPLRRAARLPLDRPVRAAGFACALLAFATVAAARAPDSSSVVSDTLDVRARSLETSPAGRPAFATVRPLDHGTRRLVTVADVVGEAAGVRVLRYGGIGALATASIRGSSAGQVEVYLDGVPLNSVQFGVTNLSELPIDNLSHAEVYRSAAPTALGTPGLGGVVHLVSRSEARPRRLVSLSSGSFGTRKATALSSGPIGPIEHLVSYRRLQSRGNFSFLYDPGTPFVNTEDDRVLERRNADFEEHAVMVKLTARPYGFGVSLADDWFLKEGGNAGHGNVLYTRARVENRRHGVHLTVAAPALARERLETSLTGFHVYQRNAYRNGDEPGLGPDQTHRTWTSGLRGSAAYRWIGARQRFEAAIEARRERFEPTVHRPAGRPGFMRERRTLSLAAEDLVQLFGERLGIAIGYRYREARDNFFGPLPFGRPPTERERPNWTTAHGPSVGARVALARGVSVKANHTRFDRFPTLFELFGTNGEVASNPELVPERANTWDAGFVLSREGRLGGRIELSVHRTTRDSVIVLVQNSIRSFKALNLQRSVARGVEVEFDVRWGGALRLDGSFTSQDVRQETIVPFYDGRWLPYVSPREFFMRATASNRFASFRHEYRYFDAYFTDRANRPERRVPERQLHAFGATSKILGRGTSVDVTIENAFDDTVSDVFGFPMPGRSLFFTVEIDLSR